MISSSIILLISLSLLFLSPLCSANTQMPKIFVDVPIIKLIDPLRSGFQIVLEKEFVHHYLNPTKLPTIFLSVLPLRQSSSQSWPKNYRTGSGNSDPVIETGLRRMMYREDVQQDSILVEGLEQRSWYYVCVEFENVVRRANRGNTSTACRLVRTLDEFGKRADGTTRDIQIVDIGPTSMEFQVAIDTDFPVHLSAYLDSEQSATPALDYLISRRSSARLRWSGLQAGVSYGRLCILETPLVSKYSMMGRPVRESVETCHFSGLTTRSSSYETEEYYDPPSRTSDGSRIIVKPLPPSLRQTRTAGSHRTNSNWRLFLLVVLFAIRPYIV